jgi:alpha-galactosidase
VWEAAPGRDFPQPVKGQFARVSAWQPFAGGGHWPDADMLPVGELRPSPGWGAARRSRLTADEQRTMLTLWAMARSPLIVGANLTLLDEATLKLLTNRAVIAVDQTAISSREVLRDGDLVVWRAGMQGGRVALAIFNLGEKAMLADAVLSRTEVIAAGSGVELKDVWTGNKLGKLSEIAPHGCVLLMSR